jgi:hypothetical protein
MVGPSLLPPALLLAATLHPAPVFSRAYPAPDLDNLWAELGTSDPQKADQTITFLVARPHLALPLLRKRLTPVCRVSPARLNRLIADLNDDRYRVRERAWCELAKRGDAVEGALIRALADPPSAEVGRRIDLLLDRLRTLRLGPPPESLRQSRGVDVLELIGSPQAREILARLAAGAPDAELTVQAKAALSRLSTSAR